MRKYSIVASGWIVDALALLYVLLPASLVLYVWVTQIRPFPNSLSSRIAYGFFICLWIGFVALICRKGFTYRWTEVNHEGMVVHEGYYAVFWKHRVVPKSNITAVERYDDRRNARFGQTWVSGIRVRLSDGSAIVLTETSGKGMHHEKMVEVRQALGMPI